MKIMVGRARRTTNLEWPKISFAVIFIGKIHKIVKFYVNLKIHTVFYVDNTEAIKYIKHNITLII